MADDAELRHELLAPAPAIPDRALDGCRVFPSREALVAALLARGSRGVEVGTQSGAFARFLLDTVKPSRLDLVDITFEQFSEGLFAHADPVVRHEGLSWEVLGTFDDASFDWIYIDASHAYEDVSRDISAAVPKLRPGGLLLFNDYTAWSPIEVAPYGVLRAVNELLQEEAWTVAGIGLQGLGYHDICLRRVAAPGFADGPISEQNPEQGQSSVIEGEEP